MAPRGPMTQVTADGLGVMMSVVKHCCRLMRRVAELPPVLAPIESIEGFIALTRPRPEVWPDFER